MKLKRRNYFQGDLVNTAEVKVRTEKLNGKAVCKNEIIIHMIKRFIQLTIDSFCKMCSMTFEGGLALEDWRNAVIIQLYGCIRKNDRGMSLLSVVGKNI